MISETRLAEALATAFTQEAGARDKPEASIERIAKALAAAVVAELHQAQVVLPISTVNVAGASGPSTNPAPIVGSLK